MMRRSRPSHGAATVEFALVCIPFFVLVLGMIQYGFYFWSAETTNSAAREAARRIVVGDCWNQDDLERFTFAHAARADSVAYSPDLMSGAAAAGDEVTVTVTADGTSLGLLPLPNAGAITREYVAHLETTTQSEPGDDSCAG